MAITASQYCLHASVATVSLPEIISMIGSSIEELKTTYGQGVVTDAEKQWSIKTCCWNVFLKTANVFFAGNTFLSRTQESLVFF